MDDLDRKLISLLRADARTSASKLASALKISRGTVQNRIDRMLARGAIQGFTIRTRPDLDPARVRAVTCIEITGERAGQVVKALRGMPQVVAIHTTNGRWDLICDLETDSLAGFSKTLDDLRRIEGIASTETNLLLSSHAV